MKTLWIISGGIEAIPGIQRAKDMGYFVVVSDGNPEAPGFQFASECIVSSTYSVEETVNATIEYDSKVRSIDGVMCMASDVPLTVAAVAEQLGLPGISIETAMLAKDKMAMKNHFKSRDIPIPWFAKVESLNHLKSIVKDRDFPLIIKPVDSRGARGVLKLDSNVDLKWAYKHALHFSPSSSIMVEEYLVGPQISTESVLIDGKAFTPGFIDRNYEYLDQFAPFMIENGGQQPSFLNLQDQAAVKTLAEKAALEMGITTGIAKGDMILTEEGPKVIEIACRLSGGWMSTNQIPLGTGVDLIGIAIRLALNEPIKDEDLQLKYQKGVAIRYFFPKTGVVKEILNINKFEQKEWVKKIGFFIKPGESIQKVTNHTKRAGLVITTGDTREEAVLRAQEVINNIRFIID